MTWGYGNVLKLPGRKKIYRPGGTNFGQKYVFFILRGRTHGQFMVLTRGGTKKIASTLVMYASCGVR